MSRSVGLHRLRGVIKSYAWGSRRILSEFLGRPVPADQPEAELWLGAHPSGSAVAEVDGEWASLDSLIQRDPEYWLGPSVHASYGRRLPFLLKLLAVEEPLSLQVHPDAERASARFEQERRLPAKERRYADPHGKPELVCALTRFEALCGVRSPVEIRDWLGAAGLGGLLAVDPAGGDAVRGLLARWLRLPAHERAPQIRQLLAAARRRAGSDSVSRRILALGTRWPEDPGLIAPVLLKEVTLEPGEALFLPPGVLHCYLSGAAIEVMGASDNVVRAGLTNKTIDIEELLAVASFDGDPPAPLRAEGGESGLSVYPASCREFQLARIESRPGQDRSLATHGPAVLLCTAGTLQVAAGGERIAIDRGAAVVIAGAAGRCVISGDGEAVRASLPAAPGHSR